MTRRADDLAADAECWQRAEWHLLGAAFAERLEELGLGPTPDAGATLVAAALFLAEHTPEWGGDARDALAELAQLGRTLLD